MPVISNSRMLQSFHTSHNCHTENGITLVTIWSNCNSPAASKHQEMSHMNGELKAFLFLLPLEPETYTKNIFVGTLPFHLMES